MQANESPTTNLVGRMLRRIGSSNDELDAEERRRAAALAGATPVAACQDRELVELAGTVNCLTVVNQEWPRLEAELDDGSGQVRLVWLGRREIRGIEPGTELRARGRVSCQQAGRVVYNPSYEIINVPN